MKVVNINGTSSNICNCGSWLKHWKRFSNQALSSYCSEKRCVKEPEVGAHVQKENSSDKNWYIIPLCKDCNAKTGESLEIVDSVVLVSANVDETCG